MRVTEQAQYNRAISSIKKNYSEMDISCFDVPGHVRSQGVSILNDYLGNEIMNMDINSSPLMDNVSNPNGIIKKAQEYGDITMLVNAAGVSPSQASIETILKVDLYGTAVLLEEVGKVIAKGGVGVTISSQSGHRMPALSQEVANVAELLMSQGGAFITGTDFLIDGGATASYFYGPLKPEV